MAYASLHDRLRSPIATALQTKLQVQNVHALPQLEKVIVNVGINRSQLGSKEMRAYIIESLRLITGQQPALRSARKSISNFKVTKGAIVGVMVTLRGRRMEEFLDRLISYCFPRIRDFRGLSAQFDGRGNYAVGIRDHSIFPEIPPPDVSKIFGLQVQIKTTAKTDKEAEALLREIGFPFRR